MKSPILGSAYVARSVNAADNRMVNLFPEIVPEAGKSPAYLQRAPGLRLLTTVGTGPIRGVNSFGNNLYVVSGEQLVKLNSNYTATVLGNVSGATETVSMANNGNQLFVACNGPSYVYNSTTDVLAQITDPDFPGALTVSYLDGYFVFIEPDSQRVWTTELNNPTSVDPLDFASAEGDPDGLVSSIVNQSQVWLFGTNSVEVWYNAAAGAGFPLERIQGAFNEIGCAATFSVAKLDNGLFWLGQDARGTGMVYRANGYSGMRISTHAVEWQIQQYDTISDAVAYTYQQDGHSFYVLNFPSANTTWVYDVATQSWHERAGWRNGAFTRHRANCQTFFNNNVTVGDYQNGNIYAFDLDVYTDHDRVQKWLRSWRALPTGENNLKRTSQHSLQLDCESGVGLTGITEENLLITEASITLSTESGVDLAVDNDIVVGANPQIMMRWSDDGGHTWSREQWAGMGKIGEYYRRVFWRRLGMTIKLRDRVYEISGTDPVKIAIMGAELIISGTNA